MRGLVIFISMILGILTIAALAFGIWLLMTDQNSMRQTLLPTIAPSDIPLPVVPTIDRPTLPPTFTPIPTATVQPTLPSLPTPTVLSATPTITQTFTATVTPIISDTPTPTYTSDAPTDTPTSTISPYPFTIRGGDVFFAQNTYNSAGCAFQAIAGQVFNSQENPLDGIVINVAESNVREFQSISGDNTLYGPAGYEVPVDSKITGKAYQVTLRSRLGTQLSPVVPVTFPSNCSQNIALIYWKQTRPF